MAKPHRLSVASTDAASVVGPVRDRGHDAGAKDARVDAKTPDAGDDTEYWGGDVARIIAVCR